MKRNILAALLALTSVFAGAQEKKVPWINNVKFSGYGMLQYQYSGKENAKANTFNIRFARFSLSGRIAKDFFWLAQIQVNGNTSTLTASPRIVDLYAEWQKYDFFRVKLGQFKNPFTFESPMNPIDQGFMGYGQAVLKLSGFSDRDGRINSNGRDIGLQVQGDFLKNASGRNLLHYQVGVFNGQGINLADVDQQKNLIGGIWVMPVKGMRIGAFGWTGSYARKGTSEAEGITSKTLRSLQERRYAFSAEYVVDDWTFRSEYIHSTGLAFAKTLEDTKGETANDITLSADGDKAQGVYALVIAPIIKKKMHIKGRYDMYQPTGDASKQKTQYEIALDYYFHPHFSISGEYAFINDRSLQKHNYSLVDVQVSYRF